MHKKSYDNSLNKDILKYLPVKILPAFSGLLTIYLLTRTLSVSLYTDYAFIIATILLSSELLGSTLLLEIIL